MSRVHESGVRPYSLLVLDADDCHLSATEYQTKREAVSFALEKIRGMEYPDWCRVEIRDAQNECVWDRNRYPKQTHCRNCGDPGPVDHCTDEFPEPGDIRETGR